MENKEINAKIEETILAIAKEPKNTEHYHSLANLYGMDSKFDQMISTYESLLEVNPKDVIALISIGSLWFYKKDYRKAFAYYNKAEEYDPLNYMIYFNLGNVYAEMKNFSKSLNSYNRAIDLNAPVVETYNAIAQLFCDYDNYVEAEVYYKQVLTFDKNNVMACLGLGNIYLKLSDYKNALIYYTRVYELYPDDKMVAVYMGNALTAMKREEEASKYFEKALEVDSQDYKTYISYAISQSEFENYDKSIELYNRAINKIAGQGLKENSAYILLGNLYADLRQFDNAQLEYQKALKINHSDAIAYMSIANADYMQGNLEKALVAYRDAIKTAPDNDEYKLVYLQILDEYIGKKAGRV